MEKDSSIVFVLGFNDNNNITILYTYIYLFIIYRLQGQYLQAM